MLSSMNMFLKIIERIIFIAVIFFSISRIDGKTAQAKTSLHSPMDSPNVKKLSPGVHDSETEKMIRVLRERGKKLLDDKIFSEATEYYLAVLQLLEGVREQEYDDLRQRCMLTLAECNIKVGNYHECLCICTELIDETPSIPANSTTADSEKLKPTLAKAFYRRGVAFSKIQEPKLALTDLQAAKLYLPLDEKIERKINQLEGEMKHQDIQNMKNDLFQKELEEILRDVVEDAMVSNPRRRLSSGKLKDLYASAKSRSIRTKGNQMGAPSSRSSPNNADGFGDVLNGFHGSDSLLGTGKGPADADGILGSLDSLAQFGPLLGLNPKHVTQIVAVLKGGYEIFKRFQACFKFIRQNVDSLQLAIILLWIGFVAYTYR